MNLRTNIITLLIAVFVLTGCSTEESLMQESADEFFEAVNRDDFGRAHRFLTRPLAERQSVEALKQFIVGTGLSDSDSLSWSASRATDDKGSLQGRLGTGDQDIPIRINFQKENSHWKIYGIERGVEVITAGKTVVLYAPSLEGSASLANTTTAAFSTAIRENDLQQFWKKTAEAFKQQYPSDQFSAAFGNFITDDINLEPATRLSAVFTRPPVIAPQGELVLAGLYPTSPSQVEFEYRYVSEQGDWRISGMSISLKPGN